MTTTASRTPTPSNLWSFSRLKTFDQCALRYQYRYLQGHKEAFRSIESFLGNVVHDVLEWLYNERDQDVNPSQEEILERFSNRWTESRGDDVAIIRIDEVEKQGASKISKLEGNVTQFPMPIYTPGDKTS